MEITHNFVADNREEKRGYIRMVYHRFELQRGEVHPGHTHDIDHVTLLLTGSVLIKFKSKDGQQRALYKYAPCHFWIDKDIEHEFIASENNTTWLCVFLPPEGYEKDLKEFWNETNLYGD